MISKPRLRNVWPASPLRPLVDDINRAIMDQSGMRGGSGFGQIGGVITKGPQDWMVAITGTDGAGAATWIDPTDKTKGRKLGTGLAYEQTIDFNDAGDVLLVPAGPDAVTEIPYFNFAVESAVQGSTLVILEKLFGLWVVTWEECSGQ